MEELAVMLAHLSEFEGQADRRKLPPDDRHNPDHFLTQGDSDAAQGAGLQTLGTAHQQTGLAQINQLAREVGSGAHEADGHMLGCPKAFRSSTCHVLYPLTMVSVGKI
jgi:hypothetical protein